MLGQRRTGKSLQFVVQRQYLDHGWFPARAHWLRVRGFPSRQRAETYIEKHPGETLRIIDLRERAHV